MIKKIIAGTVLTLATATSALAADEARSPSFYIGFEGGVNKPLSNELKFTADEKKMKFSLKRSRMYTTKVGYIFAPGMALEFSYTRQPQFKVGFKLDSYDIPNMLVGVHPLYGPIHADGKLVPAGTTKAVADIFTLNLVYDLMKLPGGITPYFIGGAGIAKIDVKPVNLLLTIPSIAQVPDQLAFSVNRSKGNYFAWQAGLGAQKALTPNIALDVSAKLQAIHNIKLRYSVLDSSTRKLKKSYVKKTLGGIELGAGLTFKF